MSSLSFPALGAGNLGFPRSLVSRVLLQQIHLHSRRRPPRHLTTVFVVVHPSDGLTVDVSPGPSRQTNKQTNKQTNTHTLSASQSFTKEFSHTAATSSLQQEATAGSLQSQAAVTPIRQVSSPSLGVYRITLQQLTLQVSSGDITKVTSDVIVNSSNPSFTLKTGVSRAILEGAGPAVEAECALIGMDPNTMILTSAGKLPSRNIVHVIGQNDPQGIRDVVFSVLRFCEEHKFQSVSFPALGTGRLKPCRDGGGGLCGSIEAEGLRSDVWLQIERVQNQTLWQSYQLMKKNMDQKNRTTNNERLLFHGTKSASVDLINDKGFNRSYAGTHGAMYGNGSYFAVDPVYSARNYAKPDASGIRRMFQARVLVGEYTQGKPGLITPPHKSGNVANLYDSVTDNTAAPSMFVVFSDIQAYPEYLITFK
uniref:Poly [ADP-ribose] polymerase n=1 Tax=Salarias fasciatus TaxID=181472 RepID=A0A672JI87_SALFA